VVVVVVVVKLANQVKNREKEPKKNLQGQLSKYRKKQNNKHSKRKVLAAIHREKKSHCYRRFFQLMTAYSEVHLG